MKKSYALFAILMVASLVLAACASPSAAATQVVTVPVEVTKLVAGTPQTITQVITATPEKKAATAAPGSVQLNGAGATFPLPVYTEWIYAYQYVDPSVTLNYQGIGSGGGKKGIIDNTIDFAGSDSLLKDDEYQKGGDLQMYPVLAGAVVPIYNIEGITATITLDRAALVGIYNATIKKWNDPVITKLNPDLAKKLPDKTITAVHRSDGSGTTEIFTNALAAFDDGWKKSPGAGASIEWPVDKTGSGVGGKGNQGVAAAVQNTPNSIGYVELSYAISNKIPFAKMVNKAGTAVTANAQSLVAAMKDFANSFDARLTTRIVDGGGKDSWPISGYTYIILHTTTMKDCTKAQKLLQFLSWALTDPAAGKRAAELGYSVLPDAVRTSVLARLGEVTCSGTAVLSK
ncbi:MAG TPA: phosphate ABC transporter substrate-binding protein PstS [Anaerolineae bacterium]